MTSNQKQISNREGHEEHEAFLPATINQQPFFTTEATEISNWEPSTGNREPHFSTAKDAKARRGRRGTQSAEGNQPNHQS